MELEDVTKLPEMIACPEPSCLAPAVVVDRFMFASTDGPVEHVKTSCADGHGFTVRTETLAEWPVAMDWRPLGAGG